MKTINQKISTSFLWLIIASLLVIMLLFNLAMRIYAQGIAQKELKSTVVAVETLIRQQVSLDAQGQLGETMLERLRLIQGSLRLSRLSSSTELVIVDGAGQVRFPKDYADSFLTDTIVDKAVANLYNREHGQISSFRSSGMKYFATSRSFAGSRIVALKLVFISSSRGLLGIARVINIILLSIIALAVVVGIVVALKLAKSISKPISDLSKHAREIGRGNFLLLPVDETSAEIYDLTNNMNEMANRLRDFDRTQKLFLQNASHELRTPLMSIQGYAEGIAKGIFSDTARTAEIICEESKRLNALLEELLTLSRIETNTYEQEFSALNLADVLRDYVQKMAGYALREDKRLELNLQDTGITSSTSDTLLSAAVINVISNCIKYARAVIDVSLFQRGDFAVIRVRDDGEGISQKDLPHIFDRFYKGKKGNFGLGLSIAKSSVEFMGGTIRAYNDNGAVFELELPVKHPPNRLQ